MSQIAELVLSDSPGIDTLLPQDERVTISRTLDGDVDAFNELVVKYQKLAYSIAYRMLQSREAAADAVQDSFLKAFRALPSFKNGSFKSWLMRIVVNTCHDAIRINRRFSFQEIGDDSSNENNGDRGESVPHQIIDPHESPADFVERMELSAQIELGLRALPPEQRLVLVLSDIHGYSYEEINEVTGFPMGTVKSRISRARLKLRDFLLQQPEVVPSSLKN
jgi:RNA polymerase sigma-70 factor (ECF subfamily)